jgi:hypothetical protein
LVELIYGTQAINIYAVISITIKIMQMNIYNHIMGLLLVNEGEIPAKMGNAKERCLGKPINGWMRPVK